MNTDDIEKACNEWVRRNKIMPSSIAGTQPTLSDFCYYIAYNQNMTPEEAVSRFNRGRNFPDRIYYKPKGATP